MTTGSGRRTNGALRPTRLPSAALTAVVVIASLGAAALVAMGTSPVRVSAPSQAIVDRIPPPGAVTPVPAAAAGANKAAPSAPPSMASLSATPTIAVTMPSRLPSAPKATPTSAAGRLSPPATVAPNYSVVTSPPHEGPDDGSAGPEGTGGSPATTPGGGDG